MLTDMWVSAGLLKPEMNPLVVLTVRSLADRVLSLLHLGFRVYKV